MNDEQKVDSCIEDLLRGFPIAIEFPVAWGDMDAFNHVNNTAYFKYFESARIAYFEALGLMETMAETQIGPILAATSCTFKIPLAYPDRVFAATRVPELGTDRFVMAYRVISQRHGKIAAEGEGTIVTLDYATGRKVPIPDALRSRIEALEHRGTPRRG